MPEIASSTTVAYSMRRNREGAAIAAAAALFYSAPYEDWIFHKFTHKH